VPDTEEILVSDNSVSPKGSRRAFAGPSQMCGVMMSLDVVDGSPNAVTVRESSDRVGISDSMTHAGEVDGDHRES
jgi:hypothetical protein